MYYAAQVPNPYAPVGAVVPTPAAYGQPLTALAPQQMQQVYPQHSYTQIPNPYATIPGYTNTPQPSTANARELQVCRAFKKDKCTYDACKFAHVQDDGPVLQNSNGTVTICLNSLSDRCTYEGKNGELCRYYHPAEHLIPKLQDQVRGTSKKALTSAATVYQNQLVSIPTPGYPHGHTQVPVAPLQLPNGVNLGPTGYSGVSFDVGQIPKTWEICKKNLRNNCTHQQCRFAHPNPQNQVKDANSVVVCHDYLIGKCARAACKFFHLPAHLFKSTISSKRQRESEAGADVKEQDSSRQKIEEAS